MLYAQIINPKVWKGKREGGREESMCVGDLTKKFHALNYNYLVPIRGLDKNFL